MTEEPKMLKLQISQTYMHARLIHAFIFKYIIIGVDDFAKIIPFRGRFITRKHGSDTGCRRYKAINQYIPIFTTM